MSFRGPTYSLPMNVGGLVNSPNIDKIPPEAMISVNNINIHEDGRGQRGGSDIFSAASTRNSQLMGGIDFTLISGTQHIVTTTTEGEVWKDKDTQLNSGNLLKTGAFTTFSIVNDKLYICDGGTTPQTWDGSAGSTSDLAAVPNDWTGSNFPTQIIIHGAGSSIRGWALGCPSTPHTLYVTPETAGGDLDFTQGTIETFHRETGDGYGLVGGVEFGDRVIVFSKNQAYAVDDTDLDIANWQLREAQWKGGVAHSRLIVKTPNDVVCMMDDGTIYSVTAVQSYGDYKEASITKPSWIDRWIRANADLSKINQFHGVYDPELRRIYINIVLAGNTIVDTALVYNIDRGPVEGWTIHSNVNFNSGYSASCSFVARRNPASHHSMYIYTGDYSGNVWELEESSLNDDSNAITSTYKTSRLTFNNPRVEKKYKRGWLIMTAQGDYNLEVRWWIDGVEQTQRSVSMAGDLLTLPFTLPSNLAGDDLIAVPFELGAVGTRIQLEVFNSNANETFFVSEILIDHTILGNPPA